MCLWDEEEEDVSNVIFFCSLKISYLTTIIFSLKQPNHGRSDPDSQATGF